MPEIIFQDKELAGREEFTVPTSAEIEKMKVDDLRECAEIFAYALSHGSGAAVRLAFPFARTIAALAKLAREDAMHLVDQYESTGRDANLGTVIVEWR